MNADSENPRSADELESLRSQVESVERKLAGEFQVSPRILVAAIAVVAVIGSLALPHTGSVTGIEIITGDPHIDGSSLVIVSKIFVWFEVLFGVFASGAALLTRRWALSVIAGAGCGVAVVFGLLSVWSRQTPGLHGEPPTGAGIGLFLGWFAMIVLAVVWIKTIWARTPYQLAAERERRDAAQEWEDFARSNRIGTQPPRPQRPTDQS
ncbi:hypothetical protein [Tsukamurella paurometabola]|uniref:Transmembrane protein n=1 Tax=Tsukamurella paurometabola TaxID=2061 RepID=A0A3P8K712_TSUPA|nr:hypothetical protein [Tsukamurella paurometabola]UEA83981.1 hypothetical protein LK411_03850 [Tsukamurella paurometabola]VDR41139.1 Uncharacterised protein [Tsukamurella paurometabola]